MTEMPTTVVSKRNKRNSSTKALSSQIVKKKTSMTAIMKGKRTVER